MRNDLSKYVKVLGFKEKALGQTITLRVQIHIVQITRIAKVLYFKLFVEYKRINKLIDVKERS